VDLFARLLGGLLPGGIFLDPSDEFFTALGVMDVFGTDVDSLLEISVADLLVDDDTDGALGDVVDDTGLAVIDLVWHTLLLSTVHSNVDNISNLVLLKEGREGDHTRSLEPSGEGITSTGSETT